MSFIKSLGYGVSTGLGAMAGYEHAGGTDASMIDKSLGVLAGGLLGAGAARGLHHGNNWRAANKYNKANPIPTTPVYKKPTIRTNLGKIQVSNSITPKAPMLKAPGVTMKPAFKPPPPPKPPEPWKPGVLSNTQGAAAGMGLTGYMAFKQGQKNRERMEQNSMMSKTGSYERFRDKRMMTKVASAKAWERLNRISLYNTYI